MSRKNWSSEKIYERLLTNKSKKTYWDNIGELRSRPNNKVFKRAFSLTNSKYKKEKIIGIDILAQLGFNPRAFKKETLKRYFELLDSENDTEVLMALFYAIGHNNENLTSKQISKMVRFKNHKNTEVRQGLVSALLGIENKAAINTLIELSEDKVSSIRNWATFGIGSQIEISNQEIKSALWKRIKDKHQETKLEAIVGLASRGVNEVKKVILDELEKGEYGYLLFEAIDYSNDIDFLPQLEKNLESAKNDGSFSENWIQALKECIEKITIKHNERNSRYDICFRLTTLSDSKAVNFSKKKPSMINWILQKNLTKPEILERIKSVLNGKDEIWEEVAIVPFSSELPEVENKDSFKIIYGSTTFMLNAFNSEEWKEGVFFEPTKFQMSNYVEKWKSKVLNSDGQLLKFGQLKNLESEQEQKWFIRPNNDGKEFGGKVETYKKLLNWSNKVCKLDIPELNKHTEIWISKPKKIKKEWRLFIVDNQIVSASRYMLDGELAESEKDIPKEMIEFAKDRISEYRIAEVYAMDIAKTENEYKLIECNCFNGTGFYKHDVEKIIQSVNTFIKKKIKKSTE